MTAELPLLLGLRCEWLCQTILFSASAQAIGTVAPGHSRDADRPILIEAGASLVLSEGVAELEALL